MMTTTFSMTICDQRMRPDEAALALEAAMGRIARLEQTLAELLLKNERLRQQVERSNAA